MYILRTLSNNPGFAKAGKDVPLSQREFMLLVILFVDVRKHYPRDEIARLIWHGSELRAARHSLAQALHSLRKLAPELQLRVAENHIAFDASAVLTDVAAFEKAVTEKNYRAGAAVYSAPFLDRRPTMSNPFLDEWCDDIRDRLTASWQFLLEHTMESESTSGNWDLVLETTEQLLKLNQTAAGWHRAKIEALYMRGDLTRAVDAIATLRLQCGDDPDIDRTVEELEEKLSSQPSTVRPFVGREPEIRALIETWQRCVHSKAETTVVIGEAGIGKTTLVTQFLRYAAIKGARTVIVNCDRRNRHAPYATILELIQLISSQARHSNEVKALIREIRAGRRPDTNAVDSSAVRDRVADALYQILQNGPQTAAQCLFLDDADNADPSSLELLADIQRTSPLSFLHLILAIRRSNKESVDGTLRLFRPRISAINLAELPPNDALRLLELLKIRDPTGAQSANILASAGGHPLYLTSLALSSSGYRSRSNPVPAELTEHIKERIASVSNAAKSVLFAIAFSQNNTGLSHLIAATRMSEEDVLSALEELSTHHLIVVLAEGSCSAHALVKDVAELLATPIRASVYHRRIAEFLGAIKAEPSLIAHHYERAGSKDQASRYLLVAIRRACRLFAASEAEGLMERFASATPSPKALRRIRRVMGKLYFELRRFDQAASTYASIPEPRSIHLTFDLRIAELAALIITDDAEAATIQLADVAAEALSVGAHTSFVNALVNLANVITLAGRPELVKAVAEQLQACLAHAKLSPVQRVTAQTVAGELLSFAGKTAEGKALVATALADPAVQTDWRASVRANNAMGVVHLVMADYAPAVDYFRHSIDQCTLAGAEHWRFDLLSNYGLALWCVGNISEADTIFREVADERSRRNSLLSITATVNLAQMWYDVGDLDKAHWFATRTLTEGGTQLGRVAMGAWAILGLVALHNRNIASAQVAYENMRRLWSELGPPPLLSYVTLFGVRYSRIMGKAEEALGQLNSVLEQPEGDAVIRSLLENERELIIREQPQ